MVADPWRWIVSAGSLPPVGAIVEKRCSCGRAARHSEAHPRYRVEGIYPNSWMSTTAVDDPLLYADARLVRIDTGRTHRTSMLLLRDKYVIVSLPTEAVLINPVGAP